MKPSSELRMCFRRGCHYHMTHFLFWTSCCARRHLWQMTSHVTPSWLHHSWWCNRRNYRMKNSLFSFHPLSCLFPELGPPYIFCCYRRIQLSAIALSQWQLNQQRGHKTFHYRIFILFLYSVAASNQLPSSYLFSIKKQKTQPTSFRLFNM